MKKFSKVLTLGLATTMLGASLVGCGGNAAETTAPATTAPATSAAATEAPAQPVTLRTVSMYGGTDPAAPLYQDYLKKFMEANPNVTIEDESATADEQWKSSVLTDFAAGNEPDVIFFFTDVNSKTLIEQGKVVSVDEIRAEYPDYAKNISEGAAKSASYAADGKLYAVPVRGYYEGLFVNKDLFEANGVELPTDWAKLETAIKTFSGKGITPIAVALGHVPHYMIEHFILAQGGIADHANKDITAVKQTWVDALTMFKTFNDMGAFPKDTATSQHELQAASFNDRKAAMFVDGNWAIGGMKDQENTILMPFPGIGNGKKDPSDIIGGFSSGYFITKKAWDDPAKRDASVKLVEFLTSNEAIKEFVGAAGGGAPAADVGEITGLSPLGAGGAAMAGAAKGVDGAVDGWVAKPAWDYLLGKVPGIAAGKEDPAAVVDKIIELNAAQ